MSNLQTYYHFKLISKKYDIYFYSQLSDNFD